MYKEAIDDDLTGEEDDEGDGNGGEGGDDKGNDNNEGNVRRKAFIYFKHNS